MNNYKFIVVPSDEFTNEKIGMELNEVCAGTGSETTFWFDNRELRGYIVDHYFVVRLCKITDKRFKFQIFEQEGGGQIRKYGIPGKKLSKKAQQAVQDLKGIQERRK